MADDLVTQLEYARRDAEARASNCAHYKARAIDLQEQVDAQAAEIARLSMLLEAVKAWAEGKPSNPPKTGIAPSALNPEAAQ